MNDAIILARDIAGDAAQKAATKINPDEDKLAQIDHPAEDNTWHDAPNLSKDNLKQQLNDRKPFSKGDAQAAVNKGVDAAQRSDGSVDPAAGANVAGGHLQDRSDVDPDTQQKADDAKGKAQEYRDRTTGYMKNKMPEERRDQTIWRLKKMVAEIQGHQDCEFSPGYEDVLRC